MQEKVSSQYIILLTWQPKTLGMSVEDPQYGSAHTRDPSLEHRHHNLKPNLRMIM